MDVLTSVLTSYWPRSSFSRKFSTEVKLPRPIILRAGMENQISPWSSR